MYKIKGPPVFAVKAVDLSTPQKRKEGVSAIVSGKAGPWRPACMYGGLTHGALTSQL